MHHITLWPFARKPLCPLHCNAILTINHVCHVWHVYPEHHLHRCSWQSGTSRWTIRRHRTLSSIRSPYMMYRTARKRHSSIQDYSESTVPVFGQLVRGIRGIPGALRLVLLNRLLYVLYTILHHWHLGQCEGPAAKGAPSCCSFHLS